MDQSPEQRIQSLEDKIIELTLTTEELLQALAYMVGRLERSGTIPPDENFRSAAVHVSQRLQDVTSSYLGSPAGNEVLRFHPED